MGTIFYTTFEIQLEVMNKKQHFPYRNFKHLDANELHIFDTANELPLLLKQE